MEPLYAFDRFVTGNLKAFDAWLISHNISRDWQRLHFFTLEMVAFAFLGRLFPFEALLLVLMVPALVLYLLFAIGFSFALRMLHGYFDPKGAARLRKEYSDGYLAWSFTVLAIISTTAMLSWVGFGIGRVLMYVTIPTFPLAYFSFVSRRGDDSGRRKRRKSVLKLLQESLQLGFGLSPVTK